jgi:hypothetical protein
MEEKKGMMEMLRRFEDEQGDGEGLMAELEEEEEETDELAQKLAGVDLGMFLKTLGADDRNYRYQCSVSFVTA